MQTVIFKSKVSHSFLPLFFFAIYLLLNLNALLQLRSSFILFAFIGALLVGWQIYLLVKKTYLQVSESEVTYLQNDRLKWQIAISDITAIDEKQGHRVANDFFSIFFNFFSKGKKSGFEEIAFNIKTNSGTFTVYEEINDFALFLEKLKQQNANIIITNLTQAAQLELKKEDIGSAISQRLKHLPPFDGKVADFFANSQSTGRDVAIVVLALAIIMLGFFIFFFLPIILIK